MNNLTREQILEIKADRETWADECVRLCDMALAHLDAQPIEGDAWQRMAEKLHSYIMKRHNYGRGVREKMRLELNNEFRDMLPAAPQPRNERS